MDALRTPDDRFTDLPDFPWEPRYLDDLPGYEGLRLHYVDAGPPDAERVALCLHGEPTWAFLYRKMIPVFTEAGMRVVVPDFFGFGRSDKPTDEAVYTFGFHRGMLLALLERLDLRQITLVCQDWGGLLGLTLPMTAPKRFERLLIMNTTLATGRVPPGDGFLSWRDYVSRTPDLDVGRLLGRSEPSLSDAERAAYDAPFPDARYKAGVHVFPAIVPIRREMEGAAISAHAADWLRNHWRGPVFLAIGEQDPVLGPPAMEALHRLFRHAPPLMRVPDAGHFVQEHGAPIARAALRTWGEGVRTPPLAP